MRSIPAIVLAEMKEEGYIPFYCIAFQDDDDLWYRFTDADVPIIYDGERYEPRGFELSPVQYTQSKTIDKVSLDIDNVDSLMTNAFVGGTMRGREFFLYLVVLGSE